jgi:hypothetical protein
MLKNFILVLSICFISFYNNANAQSESQPPYKKTLTIPNFTVAKITDSSKFTNLDFEKGKKQGTFKTFIKNDDVEFDLDATIKFTNSGEPVVDGGLEETEDPAMELFPEDSAADEYSDMVEAVIVIADNQYLLKAEESPYMMKDRPVVV